MDRRFTLFHIDSERGLRGGERQLLYLACRLRALGHRNVVVCRRGSPLAAEAARRGLETLHLPFLAAWDPVSAWRLRREAAQAGAILHAHTGHGASLASMTGLRWVAHRRVDFPLSGSFSRRFKYARAARVVAVSEFIKRLLVSEGLPGSKVSVVPDAIPLGAEAREAGETSPFEQPSRELRGEERRSIAAEWGLPEDAAWVGSLAALVPHKDPATLLRAAPAVLRARPETRFLFVGEGPLRGALERESARLGLSGEVVFAGFQRDPRRWLRALDVFALSSWGEGMGSVLLEAMACGVPVVATTAGGIPEIVSDRRTGLLVPPRDPEALAAAVLETLARPDEAARRAREASLALADFSLSRQGERMLRVYEEACA